MTVFKNIASVGGGTGIVLKIGLPGMEFTFAFGPARQKFS
jgi:hypothetical protein